MEQKHIGAHNELVATCWLLQHGYEVFRNVSPHGYVDIIGMKEGKLTLFDVKKASILSNGEPTELKLRAEQIALGVKLLMVFGEGYECRVVDEPKTVYYHKDACKECGREFTARKARQTFCSNGCRVAVKNRKRYICEKADGIIDPCGEIVKCGHCGSDFKRRKRGQVFCSTWCRSSRGNERIRVAKEEAAGKRRLEMEERQ